ncbi:hypothetical protein SFC69_26125, partial [Priestia filamentosa]
KGLARFLGEEGAVMPLTYPTEALKWTQRDTEFLIRGIVPKKYFKIKENNKNIDNDHNQE